MFATKLDLFSIETIEVPTHIEPIFKLVDTPNLNVAKPIPKQHVEWVYVLAINLVILLDIIKQHMLETFFHLEVGDMIIDETFAWKQIQDLTKIDWTIIEEKQLLKVNLGTKGNVQQVKVNSTLEPIVTEQFIELLKEFKGVFAWTYKDLKGIPSEII